MKQFLISLLGSLVALFIFSVAIVILGVGIVGAIVAAQMRSHAPSAEKIENRSYLVLDLSTNFVDAPPRYELFNEDHEQSLELRTAIRALRRASQDDRIKGLLLTGSLQPSALGSGYGALAELRTALRQFRDSGKPVRAYLDFVTTRDYYLASVANQITINPFGEVYMPGLAVVPAFFAGTFEKYGIGVQVTRVGKYKSFAEQYTRENMSPEAREETQRLIDDIWGSITNDVARSRGLNRAAIQTVVDNTGLIRADQAKAAHLVDDLKYRDQLIEEIKAQTGSAEGNHSFRQVSISNYIQDAVTDAESTLSGDGIAIVYAEGDIVDGDGSSGDIGGDRYSRELRKLRQDDKVKAIVLRVNSPGGSATASEEILREVELTRQVKPVVISMGSYAASGGYYISSEANRIFAEPTTITGSIGVFALQFDVQRLANNWGVTFDTVKTGRMADALTITRPKTPEELAILQGGVDWMYKKFVAHVSVGRHLSPDQVEEIAQGRVWSGIEAKRLHLVDEIGGLRAAVYYAATQAHLNRESPEIMEYPRKQDLKDAINELLGRTTPEEYRSHASVVGQVEQTLEHQWNELRSFNDPQGLYARLPVELSLK
jgi:protease-4